MPSPSQQRSLSERCGGGGTPRAQLRVIVPDAELRAKGEPCAGAEPFGYVHASAPFRVLDGGGKTVTSGKLPEGTAAPIFNAAAGGVDRQPTNCQMIVPLSMPASGSYRFLISAGEPLKFTFKGGKATVEVQ